jgi:hypothetical protein
MKGMKLFSAMLLTGSLVVAASATPVSDFQAATDFAMKNLDSPYTITSGILGNSSGTQAGSDWERLVKAPGSLTGSQSLATLASPLGLSDTAFLTGTATSASTIRFAVTCPTAIGKTVTVQIDATTSATIRITAISGFLYARLANVAVTEDPVQAGTGRNVFLDNDPANTSFIELKGNVAVFFPSTYRVQPANFVGYGGSGVLPPKLTITVATPDFGPGPGNQPAVIKLSNGQTFNVTLSASGQATVRPNAPGTYVASVKLSHWLSSQHVNVDLSTADQVRTFTMVNGDIDTDDEVSILDYIALSTAFESTATSSNWDVRADLDGDGEVSILDYLILSSNFGQAGPTNN